MPRPGMLHDSDRHDPDGPRAGDEHVLSEHREGERSVHGVTKWVKDGGDIELDPCMMTPDVGHGKRNQLGERSGAIHADALRRATEMPSSRQAIAAAAAHHVPFAADDA